MVVLPASQRQSRIQVAEFWDNYLRRWLDGDRSLEAPLDQWYDAYKGSGPGQVDTESFPDPFVGDLRGEEREPVMVMLGVNPGIGYPPLQAANGLWAKRIKQQGYSKCFSRSPEEDTDGWMQHHNKRSRFWAERMKFADAWVGHKVDVRDVLMMELYPWHSRRLSAPVRPASDLVDKFFLSPIAELEAQHVFAFSSDWLRMAKTIGLSCIFSEVLSRNVADLPKWSLNLFDLPGKKTLVVSTFPNSQPPYGTAEFPKLLEILDRVGRPRP